MEKVGQKIEELKHRTVIVLKKTKKNMNKYINERKKLDEYFIKSSNDEELKEWEEFLRKIEKNLEEGK